MAYLQRIDTAGSQPFVLPPRIAQAPAPSHQAADFTPLEWSIVRLTRDDRLWTIRPFGPLRRWFNWLQGRGNPQLANERLEALRRMAVLSRHYGFTVTGEDVADFLSAGFSTDQYELLVGSTRMPAPTPAVSYPSEAIN